MAQRELAGPMPLRQEDPPPCLDGDGAGHRGIAQESGDLAQPGGDGTATRVRGDGLERRSSRSAAKDGSDHFGRAQHSPGGTAAGHEQYGQCTVELERALRPSVEEVHRGAGPCAATRDDHQEQGRLLAGAGQPLPHLAPGRIEPSEEAIAADEVVGGRCPRARCFRCGDEAECSDPSLDRVGATRETRPVGQHDLEAAP